MRMRVTLKSSEDISLSLPGSKYLANRYLILAALCQQPVELRNLPVNEDIRNALKGIEDLGATVIRNEEATIINGCNFLKEPKTEIYSGDSGTFSRFIFPLMAIHDKPLTLKASAKMSTRPMADLVEALQALGATVSSSNEQDKNCLPLSVTGPLTGESVHLSARISSQYLSALLMLGTQLPKGLRIQLSDEPVSKPFIEMTLKCIREFGGSVEANSSLSEFVVNHGLQAPTEPVVVETDPSSCSYFLASATLTGQKLTIKDFNPERSVQGEAGFYRLLEAMGAEVTSSAHDLTISGRGLNGITIDMNALPDVVQTLAAVAVFADSPTEITGIHNLAFKESNRIEDTARELRKLGANIETTDDSMTIYPLSDLPDSVTFDTYEDHRMAMSLSLIASRVQEVIINDANVVAKSFPDYWQYLSDLGYACSEL